MKDTAPARFTAPSAVEVPLAPVLSNSTSVWENRRRLCDWKSGGPPPIRARTSPMWTRTSSSGSKSLRRITRNFHGNSFASGLCIPLKGEMRNHPARIRVKMTGISEKKREYNDEVPLLPPAFAALGSSSLAGETYLASGLGLRAYREPL